MSPVTEEENDESEDWSGYYFPTPCPGVPDWSQYQGSANHYKELVSWAPALASEV
jgi:hypothetical protein